MATTNTTFGARTTALEVVASVDGSGKNCIVTGASSGLGIETARAMAKAKFHVILAVRDTEKAKPVAADIIKTTENKNVEIMELDLADLKSVEKFATAFKSKKIPLHLLLNNAGIMACPFEKTKQGFESQWGTNHIGHSYLTLLLLPSLIAAKGARVVNVSSLGHMLSDVFYDDPNFTKGGYDEWKAYGQAKTANILFAMGLQTHFSKDGISGYSLHPGGIMTGLQNHVTRETMEKKGWISKEGKFNEQFKTIEQGASTTVVCATQDVKPGYFQDCAPAAAAKHITEENAAKLWKITIEALKPYLATSDEGLSKQLTANL